MTLVPSVHPKFQLTTLGYLLAVTVMFEANVGVGSDAALGGYGGDEGEQISATSPMATNPGVGVMLAPVAWLNVL